MSSNQNGEQAGGARFRSLKAMAEGKMPGIQKATYFKIDPMLLEVEEGFNGRMPDSPRVLEHIASMKQAFLAGASFPPIEVRVEDGRAFVVEGHCRRQMYRELVAEGHEIHAVEVKEFKGSNADRVAHIAGSSQGLALTPLEQALVYRRLERFGWEPDQIAGRVARSITHVKNLLLLAEADVEIQQMVRDDLVAADIAVDVIKKHGSKALAVLKEGLSQAQAAGKRKVTAKAIEGARVPPKVASAVLSSVDTVVASLAKTTRRQLAELEGLSPAQVKGRTISVDALAMLELLKAHQEAEAVRAKQAERASEAQARAAQQVIE